jgi:hypothetical protein
MWKKLYKTVVPTINTLAVLKEESFISNLSQQRQV